MAQDSAEASMQAAARLRAQLERERRTTLNPDAQAFIPPNAAQGGDTHMDETETLAPLSPRHGAGKIGNPKNRPGDNNQGVDEEVDLLADDDDAIHITDADILAMVDRTTAIEKEQQNIKATQQDMLTVLLDIQSRLMTMITPPSTSLPPPTVGPTRVGLETSVHTHEGISTGNTYIKDLKPPLYDGEEADCNKDAVNTFLQKWHDLHSLKHTPDNIRALEASVTLRGKAYKWWMSMRAKGTEPRTWTAFEEAFKKEFLPMNELATCMESMG